MQNEEQIVSNISDHQYFECNGTLSQDSPKPCKPKRKYVRRVKPSDSNPMAVPKQKPAARRRSAAKKEARDEVLRINGVALPNDIRILPNTAESAGCVPKPTKRVRSAPKIKARVPAVTPSPTVLSSIDRTIEEVVAAAAAAADADELQRNTQRIYERLALPPRRPKVRRRWSAEGGIRHEALERLEELELDNDLQREMYPLHACEVSSDSDSDEPIVFRPWHDTISDDEIAEDMDNVRRAGKVRRLRDRMKETLRDITASVRCMKRRDRDSKRYVRTLMDSYRACPEATSRLLTEGQAMPRAIAQPVVLRKLKCDFTRCENVALPLVPYCVRHILHSKNQRLFSRCRHFTREGSTCFNPVVCHRPVFPLCSFHSKSIHVLPDLASTLRYTPMTDEDLLSNASFIERCSQRESATSQERLKSRSTTDIRKAPCDQPSVQRSNVPWERTAPTPSTIARPNRQVAHMISAYPHQNNVQTAVDQAKTNKRTPTCSSKMNSRDWSKPGTRVLNNVQSRLPSDPKASVTPNNIARSRKYNTINRSNANTVHPVVCRSMSTVSSPHSITSAYDVKSSTRTNDAACRKADNADSSDKFVGNSFEDGMTDEERWQTLNIDELLEMRDDEGNAEHINRILAELKAISSNKMAYEANLDRFQEAVIRENEALERLQESQEEETYSAENEKHFNSVDGEPCDTSWANENEPILDQPANAETFDLNQYCLSAFEQTQYVSTIEVVETNQYSVSTITMDECNTYSVSTVVDESNVYSVSTVVDESNLDETNVFNVSAVVDESNMYNMSAVPGENELGTSTEMDGPIHISVDDNNDSGLSIIELDGSEPYSDINESSNVYEVGIVNGINESEYTPEYQSDKQSAVELTGLDKVGDYDVGLSREVNETEQLMNKVRVIDLTEMDEHRVKGVECKKKVSNKSRSKRKRINQSVKQKQAIDLTEMDKHEYNDVIVPTKANPPKYAHVLQTNEQEQVVQLNGTDEYEGSDEMDENEVEILNDTNRSAYTSAKQSQKRMPAVELDGLREEYIETDESNDSNDIVKICDSDESQNEFNAGKLKPKSNLNSVIAPSQPCNNLSKVEVPNSQETRKGIFVPVATEFKPADCSDVTAYVSDGKGLRVMNTREMQSLQEALRNNSVEAYRMVMVTNETSENLVNVMKENMHQMPAKMRVMDLPRLVELKSMITSKCKNNTIGSCKINKVSDSSSMISKKTDGFAGKNKDAFENTMKSKILEIIEEETVVNIVNADEEESHILVKSVDSNGQENIDEVNVIDEELEEQPFDSYEEVMMDDEINCEVLDNVHVNGVNLDMFDKSLDESFDDSNYEEISNCIPVEEMIEEVEIMDDNCEDCDNEYNRYGYNNAGLCEENSNHMNDYNFDHMYTSSLKKMCNIDANEKFMDTDNIIIEDIGEFDIIENSCSPYYEVVSELDLTDSNDYTDESYSSAVTTSDCKKLTNCNSGP